MSLLSYPKNVLRSARLRPPCDGPWNWRRWSWPLSGSRLAPVVAEPVTWRMQMFLKGQKDWLSVEGHGLYAISAEHTFGRCGTFDSAD